MSILSADERNSAQAIAELAYCNPFAAQRIELERAVLQDAFIWTDDAWHKRVDISGEPPNIDLMTTRARDLADTIRGRLMNRPAVSDRDLALYENVVLYFLYNVHHPSLHSLITGAETERGPSQSRQHAPFYKTFLADLKHYLSFPNYTFSSLEDPVHLYACLFQLRRAFHFIYENIIGGSMSAARFRAAVWQSIFTHDQMRYRRTLYRRMGDIATLIMGPSGTGKELVAQAIGLARYIPFDAKQFCFEDDFLESIHALNLSALSSTLIESELFGHRHGAFTGAIQDKKGWFEICPSLGTVFLDEIGEVEQAIQVKLLRVLQTRTFQPIGSTDTRHFQGKMIAATNRDLAIEMEAGRFRADLYYRLCSDIIVTPSLHDQIQESPDHLHNLLLFVSRRITGEEEAIDLAHEVEAWVIENLGLDYAWPGNIRELEQCVRNILIRRTYTPSKIRLQSSRDELAIAVREGRLTADALLRHYITMVYGETGNYQETARRLGLDGRTVKSKVDPELLNEYRTKN